MLRSVFSRSKSRYLFVVASLLLINLLFLGCNNSSSGGGGSNNNSDGSNKPQNENQVKGKWMSQLGGGRAIHLVISDSSILFVMQCPANEILTVEIPIKIKATEFEVLAPVSKKVSDQCAINVPKGPVPYKLTKDTLIFADGQFTRIQNNETKPPPVDNNPTKPNPPNDNPDDTAPFNVGMYTEKQCQGTFNSVNINIDCANYKDLQVLSVEGSDGCFDLNRVYTGQEVCEIIKKNR